jgi:uncharacterized damage-inducible protein DinB
MKISQALLTDFKTEAGNTRRMLEVVPESEFGFRPHEKSMPLAQLAGHVADGAAFTHVVMEPEVDWAAPRGEWKPFVPKTRAELLATADKVAADFEGRVKGRDDAFMEETWTMRAGDKILWQCPRHVALRTMGIHHIIHHRAQLGVYLRLRGVPLPPLYGPTADVPRLF